jgi:hypothetical protein
MFTHPVGFMASGLSGPLAIAAVASGPLSAASYSANMGSARSDLFALVVVRQGGTSTVAPTSVTVGGQALTKISDLTGVTNRRTFWLGRAPAGTQTVVISGGTQSDFCSATYLVTGSDNPRYYVDGSVTFGTSGSWNMPAGGVLAVVAESSSGLTYTGVNSTTNVASRSGYTAYFGIYASSAAQNPHTVTTSSNTYWGGCVLQP